MNPNCVLRIYFNYGQKCKQLTLWQRFWNPKLGYRLLKQAKKQPILQANIFRAKAGYLEYGNIVYDISDTPPSKNTVCLELVDNEHNLREFIQANDTELKHTFGIFMYPNVEIIKY